MTTKLYILNKLTSVNSVGRMPAPTLVVYALTTPITSSTFVAGTPSPVRGPPTVHVDDVTNGYVPKEESKHYSNFRNSFDKLKNIQSSLLLSIYTCIHSSDKDSTKGQRLLAV